MRIEIRPDGLIGPITYLLIDEMRRLPSLDLWMAIPRKRFCPIAGIEGVVSRLGKGQRVGALREGILGKLALDKKWQEGMGDACGVARGSQC